MTGFIKLRLNRDNFWNLMFWLGMSVGTLISEYLSDNRLLFGISVCIMLFIVPFIIKTAQDVKFDEKYGFFAGNIDELIDKTESYYAIPSGLLKSIARVESGNKPYALNIAGRPIIVNSKEEAASIVRFYQNAGITNIDLGIAQINLRWHGKHFSSISEMLEPKSNLEYAAKLLNELYLKHGSWCKAVRHYHSANPDYHRKYSRKVLIAWFKGDDILNNINVK